MRKLREWLRSRRVMGSALRLALVLMIASILAIIVAGLLLQQNQTALTVAFGILGAVLQAAFLGLVYEVWLRAEVEDATLEKLGTSRDVREHGLIRLDAEANIDWPTLVKGAKELTVLSGNPQSLIGTFDNLIIRSARDGSLRDFRIVIPSSAWADNEKWCEAFIADWSASAPASTVFAVTLDGDAGFDLVATETRTLMLLKRFHPSPSVASLKLLEFRERNADGIGAWLAAQSKLLKDLTPINGYSPLERRPELAAASTPAPDEETLT